MRRFEAAQSLSTLALACFFLSAPRISQGQVQVTVTGSDHVSIEIDGQPFSEFFIGAAYSKPFLAPLRSAADQIVTRRFPMEQVEGETRDHPHHKGLWIGYGDVNGINFWETEDASTPSGENPKEKGKIRLVKLEQADSGKKSGSVSGIFDWLGSRDEAILEEHRGLVFSGNDKIRQVDVDMTMTAQKAVKFGDTKEGFFAIRVADSMTGKNGGILSNSEGAHTEKDVWGKPADWVDYVGPVNDKKVGILILDHPLNPNHPPRWHARDYGLFAVNPFGITDFDPKVKTKGGYSIPQGGSARFRYRVIIHAGDISKKEIARWYSEYAKMSK